MWTSVFIFLQVLATPEPQLTPEEVAEKMQLVERLYDSLDYEELVPVLMEVTESRGVDEDTLIRAYYLYGAVLAVMGATVEAEGPFRELLALDPDFDPGDYEPEGAAFPKVVAVLSKVRLEEEQRRLDARAEELQSILQRMSIEGGPNESPVGGWPLVFRYRLTDPPQLVESFFVHYRRAGVADYSSLPLNKQEDGKWLGDIPGQWTESAEDYVLEYHVSTQDAEGSTLLVDANAYDPHKLEVAAGTLEQLMPFYDRPWFWAAAGVAAAALLSTTGYLLYERGQPQDGAAVLVLD